VLSAKRLDFYLTRSGAFLSGFDAPLTCPAPSGLAGCQCISLLRSPQDELLLAAFDNTGFVNPPIPKRNAARLFRVRLASPDDGDVASPLVESLDISRPFVCPQGLINFDGGAAFDARNDALTLHTVFHFRDSRTGLLQIARFA